MRRRRLLALSCLWLLAAPAVLAADQQALPPGYTPDPSSDEAGLWMQVQKTEATVKTLPNLVTDQKLNAYVSGIICKLAGDYCPSIRVYIIDTPIWNASCYPNGMVLVNTGLLLQMKNEAQFSFVLGHEITHYVKRHVLNRWRNSINTTGFLAIFSVAVAGVAAGTSAGNPNGAISLANSIGGMSMMAFSRDQERDADDGGFHRAAALGYAPQEAPAIWQNMVEDNKADPNYSRSLFYASHPGEEERVAANAKWAAEIGPTRSDWVTNESQFRAAMAPFVGRWIEEELALAQPERSVEIFRRLAASMPSVGVYQYGLGEAYRRRNGKNDLAAAENAYRGAVTAADAAPEAWRGLGLLAMKRRDNPAAKEAFSRYRAERPEASDKAMIDFYLNQL